MRIVISFILLLIGIIAEVILFINLHHSEKTQKFALRLLLHVPGIIALSNSLIMSTLSECFDPKANDHAFRKEEFYKIAVDDLPDSVITRPTDIGILTANKSRNRIFNIDPQEIVGKEFATFTKLFHSGILSDLVFEGAMPFEREAVFINQSGSEKYILLHFHPLQYLIIINSHDTTQAVLDNKLITEERRKID
jgi:PAS domain-containing protein